MRLCVWSKEPLEQMLSKGHGLTSVPCVPRPTEGLLAPGHRCPGSSHSQEMGPPSKAASLKQGLLSCPCYHSFQAEPGWQKLTKVLKEAEGKGQGGEGRQEERWRGKLG